MRYKVSLTVTEDAYHKALRALPNMAVRLWGLCMGGSSITAVSRHGL